MAQRPIRDELEQKIRELENLLEARAYSESEIREYKERYEQLRNLVERAQDGIVILHREKLVYVNRCFAKLTGYQVGELEGRSATIIIPPELQAPLRERYRRRLKGENELTIYESQLMHREGRRIDVEFNIGVIRYQGEPANLTIVRDITERKRIEKERIQSEKRLRYLSSRLLKSQESERKRLSNELHDELGQSLALLKHMLRSATRSSPGPPTSSETSNDETIAFVDHIIENLRRITKDLSPTILEDLGLTAALQWALDNFSRKHSIETFIRTADIDNLYSAEVKVNIYRIIQESLNNIGKHARAEHVSVAVHRKKGGVSFTIEDDGSGFELGRVKMDNFARSGMGLDIMTERAHMIGASIEIDSAPGKGTRIRLHVPSRIHL